MMLIKALAIVAVGALLGAALGATRTCTDGGCPLTANPWRGAIWGGFIGLMAVVAMSPGLFPAPPVAESVKEITTQDDFQAQVMKDDGPSVVFFHADWCSPCRRFIPTFNEIAGDYSDQVQFVHVNLDKARRLAVELGVRAVPTLLYFKDGEEVGRMEGAPSRGQFKDILENLQTGPVATAN